MTFSARANNKSSLKAGYILAIALGVLLLAADQISKYFVANNFELYESFPLIPRLLNFCYIHNTGGAWGMLSDKTWLLIIITALVMGAVIFWLIKKKVKNMLLFYAVCLILSGGAGNMADRIFRGGRVVDFIQFGFWKSFPVFNIADCGVVIGCALLILYLIIDTVKETKEKKQNANL